MLVFFFQRRKSNGLFCLCSQVKTRTLPHNQYSYGSHVMEYGNLNLNNKFLDIYMGTDPANENFTFTGDNSLPSLSTAVNQRDADLVYFWTKVDTPFL